MSNYKRWRDLAVRTGSYQNAQGEQKNRYENVGVVLRSGNDLMILLKPTFNPAGVPRKEGEETIVLSLFEIKDNSEPRPAATATGPTRSDAADDDVPF